MQNWLSTLNFDWIGVTLVVWIVLIALVGYAAALSAWRSPRLP